jgi:hypothetical protein
VDADTGLDALARAYLAAAGGDADRALRLALADAREALAQASARISFGYVRGCFPVGPAVAVAEPGRAVTNDKPSPVMSGVPLIPLRRAEIYSRVSHTDAGERCSCPGRAT